MGRERKRSLLPALRAPSPGTLAFLNGWAGLLRVRELLCVIIMRHHYASSDVACQHTLASLRRPGRRGDMLREGVGTDRDASVC